jgi:membrane-associated phospholipid phosphatase
MQQTNAYWQLITHLGSSSLLMPILAIALIGLWLASQKKVVHLWIMGLTLAVTITVISKVIFLGWGIGIASLNFTGISGHTLLATSILPILFCSVVGGSQTKFKNIGLWFGLILSFSVGISRIVLGMHSISEVVAGWMIGLVVCSVTLNAMESHRGHLAYLQLSLLIFLLAIGSTTPNYLPTHDMEIKLALLLSGHDKPYTRFHLSPEKIT